MQQMQPFIISITSSSVSVLSFGLIKASSMPTLCVTTRSRRWRRGDVDPSRRWRNTGRGNALAELVLDDGYFLAVLRREDVVQERRLARAEEAGEDRDWDFVLGHGFRLSGCFLS